MSRPGVAVWCIATFIALAVGATSAAAVSLSQIGPTYEVREPNLLEFIRARIEEKARTGELKRLEEQFKWQAEESVRNPQPVPGLSQATAARTFYYDPTFVLDRNVFDDKGNVLFPAGTRKNPLEVVSMTKRLLFFDARDSKQVRNALYVIDSFGGRVKPILVGGSYVDLMKAWNVPVYFDQHGDLTRQLGILHVPALVSQEGMRLRIDELVVM